MAIKEKNKNKKGCKNCKHFLQYYIRGLYGFVPIEKGNCMCPQLSPEERMSYDYFKGCKEFSK